jgi:fructose-1,6-bisphosphatase/inositol monophosphatase family enzyme
MRADSAREVPAHGIHGEAWRVDARDVRVLDLIDGTRAFITGRLPFGTLIALCREGAGAGVCDCAALGERWVASPAGRRRITRAAPPHGRRARALRQLDQALPAVARPTCSTARAPPRATVAGAGAAAVRRRLLQLRPQVASGYMDPYRGQPEAVDFAALVPIIAGAGGVALRLAGPHPA